MIFVSPLTGSGYFRLCARVVSVTIQAFRDTVSRNGTVNGMKNIIMAMAITAGAAVTAAAAETVRLETPQATCEISRIGARVMSFKVRGEEILFAPREWKHGGGSFTAGGIPICWPWFGKSGPEGSKGHGFAHSLEFEVKNLSGTSVTLCARSSDETRRIWPFDFELEYIIALDGDALTLRLQTVNTSAGPMLLTSGFHPYFLVGERDKAVVKGVDGKMYCDSRVTTAFDTRWQGDLAVNSAYDHVFAAIDGEYALVDGVRGLTVNISAKGNKRLVVWNPGDARPAADPPPPGALGPGDWRRFVCVEPATLWKDQAFELAPGGKNVFSARISVTK